MLQCLDSDLYFVQGLFRFVVMKVYKMLFSLHFNNLYAI